MGIYYARQLHIKARKAIGKYDLEKVDKYNYHYKVIHSQAAQQILRSVAESFCSYFGLIKAYSEGKIADKPRIHNYRKKGKLRLATVSYPAQALKLKSNQKRMLAITGIVEDLPQEENRIELGKDGKIRLFHKFHPYDVYRSRYYKRKLKKVFQLAGTVLSFGATGDKDDIHTSHQVGTTRFGTDPNTSVLDKDCRLHDHENVFIVDGGFMPNALGFSPALTIAANALRVGDIMLGKAII
ncbi:MAG: GMC oxidoreductase [Microcoleaceae cyanobacterium MO_207.B10]|nr:GMC oxidoreductase [Microcoleaceae cyanobacterium MO_207.B10]